MLDSCIIVDLVPLEASDREQFIKAIPHKDCAEDAP